MTKNLYLLFILFLVQTLSAQNNLYVVYNTSTFFSKSQSTLLASKTHAVYEDGFLSADALDGDIGDNEYLLGGMNKSRIYQSIDNPNLIKLQIFKNNNPDSMIRKDYNLRDEMPEMNWIINHDKPTTEILGYTCQEATVEFRGSKFIAYFTNDIPTTFGPWKFHGLPGLILSVKSQDNPAIYWEAEEITYPSKVDIPSEPNIEIFNMTLQEHIEEIDNFAENVGKNMAAKFGTTYQPVPPQLKRSKSVERKYEWETW